MNLLHNLDVHNPTESDPKLGMNRTGFPGE